MISLFSKKKSEEEEDPIHIFGEPLDTQTLDENHVPNIVNHCIDYLLENDERLQAEGLFRVSGSSNQIKLLKGRYMRGEFDDQKPNFDELFTANRPHNVASLMKTYFRELPEPLLTYSHYDMFIASDGIPDSETRKKVIHDVLKFLPLLNYRLIKKLCHFLKRVHEVPENRMDAQSLAIVFAPNILRPPPSELSPGELAQTQLHESSFATRLTESLIVNYDDFFPEEDLRHKEEAEKEKQEGKEKESEEDNEENQEQEEGEQEADRSQRKESIFSRKILTFFKAKPKTVKEATDEIKRLSQQYTNIELDQLTKTKHSESNSDTNSDSNANTNSDSFLHSSSDSNTHSKTPHRTNSNDNTPSRSGSCSPRITGKKLPQPPPKKHSISHMNEESEKAGLYRKPRPPRSQAPSTRFSNISPNTSSSGEQSPPEPPPRLVSPRHKKLSSKSRTQSTSPRPRYDESDNDQTNEDDGPPLSNLKEQKNVQNNPFLVNDQE